MQNSCLVDEAIVDHTDNDRLKLHKHFPKIHLLTTWADELTHEERILDAVQSIIGPDILARSTGIFTRAAGSHARLAWHQDIAYFGLENFDRAVRVWIALTPTSSANGTMRFAPGTHRQGIAPHQFAGHDPASIAQGEQVVADIDDAQAVDVVLDAGQCSIHHLALAHCSGANSSDSDRINFTVDYIAPDVRPSRGADSAVLARGRDTHGYYELEPRPCKDFGANEAAAYFRAIIMRDRMIFSEMQARASR
jgi:ectoine hydroxylase-related dioxygenase (phytanoyl-CoA dioxygenase family)